MLLVSQQLRFGHQAQVTGRQTRGRPHRQTIEGVMGGPQHQRLINADLKPIQQPQRPRQIAMHARADDGASAFAVDAQRQRVLLPAHPHGDIAIKVSLHRRALDIQDAIGIKGRSEALQRHAIVGGTHSLLRQRQRRQQQRRQHGR
jgi:hypothetical protein